MECCCDDVVMSVVMSVWVFYRSKLVRPAADSLDLGRDMFLRPRPGANLRANLVLYTALHGENINIISYINMSICMNMIKIMWKEI